MTKNISADIEHGFVKTAMTHDVLPMFLLALPASAASALLFGEIISFEKMRRDSEILYCRATYCFGQMDLRCYEIRMM